MRAVKGNKEYTIDETQKKFYQDSGFDIIEDTGEVIAYGRGKTIPYEEHMDAVKEIDKLRKLVSDLRKENEELKANQEDAGIKQAAEEKKEKAGAKKAGE